MCYESAQHAPLIVNADIEHPHSCVCHKHADYCLAVPANMAKLWLEPIDVRPTTTTTPTTTTSPGPSQELIKALGFEVGG